MDNPQIKLFLSVDISGSTRLKNTNNYSRILDFCKKYLSISKEIKEDSSYTEKDIYSVISREETYQDWSKIITRCFDDFHVAFTNRTECTTKHTECTTEPWKMAGDELIYCYDVSTRKEVYDLVRAFFYTLRFFDKKYLEKGSYIRLKGSAWTAGFPIRNRIMTPIKGNGDKKSIIDYMGPEIDTGFRIGKFTFPGIMVVSLDLAAILLNIKISYLSKSLRIIDTGWEVLKGVWNEKKYPIYWLALPENIDKTEEDSISYIPYKLWEKEEDSHVKSYDSKLKNNETEDFNSILELINSLPKEFGVIPPYFVNEGDKLPSEHKELTDFINDVEDIFKNGSEQNNFSEVNKLNSDDINSNENIQNRLKSALDGCGLKS